MEARAAYTTHPTAPDTDILSIERSEHKAEVFGLLCSGVSPSRTATLIQQRYGETLQPEEVAAFATQIPEEYFLKPGELQRRVKFVDVEIDTIGELAAVLRYFKDEVEVALIATRLSSGDSNVTEDTRKLMGQYWTKLIKFEELRGELGLVPVAQQQVAAPAEATLPSLRQLVLQQNLIVPPEVIATFQAQAAQVAQQLPQPKAEFVDAEVVILPVEESHEPEAEGS